MNTPVDPNRKPQSRTAPTFGKRKRPTLPRPEQSRQNAGPDFLRRNPDPRSASDPHGAGNDGASSSSLLRSMALPIAAFTVSVLALLLVLSPREATTDGASDAPQAQSSPATDTDPGGLRAIRQARSICRLMDTSFVTSSPCEVGPMSITMYAPVSIPDAQVICATMAKRTREDTYYILGGRWRFEIRSPLAAGQAIAWCWL